MNEPINAREIFARNLKAILRQKGLDQVDLANYMGVSSSTASDWCTGKKYPRVDKMQKMADWLGVLKSDLTEEKQGTNIIPITGMVPIVGSIPAGVPVLAQENIEGYLPVVVKNPEEYFSLRVHGTSMINAGIPDGSLVLIHQQPDAEDGQIVACRVNGDEATLKRFKRVGDTVFLMPDNPEFDPIIVKCSDFNSGYAEIIGVAKQVITELK
jgi:repressor LexA